MQRETLSLLRRGQFAARALSVASVMPVHSFAEADLDEVRAPAKQHRAYARVGRRSLPGSRLASACVGRIER